MTAPYTGGGGQGMDQMIRMLQAITSMQSTRRALDLEEAKLKESHTQFARSMGATEKSDRLKALEVFARLAGDLPADARGKLMPAAQAAGLGPEMVDMVMSGPQSLKAMLDAKAAQGVPQLNAQSVAGQAAGIGTAGQQQSDALNALAAIQGQRNPQMVNSLAERMSGFNPLNSQVEKQISKDPDLLSAYAKQMSGFAQQAYQAREASVGERQASSQEAQVQGNMIDSRMRIAADLVMAGLAQRGRDFSQQIAAARTLQGWAAQIKGLKGNEKLARIQQFNAIAQQFGWGQLAYTGDGKPEDQEQVLGDIITKLGPMTGVPLPGQAQPPQFGGQPQPPAQNPLMPFLNPNPAGNIRP